MKENLILFPFLKTLNHKAWLRQAKIKRNERFLSAKFQVYPYTNKNSAFSRGKNQCYSGYLRKK